MFQQLNLLQERLFRASARMMRKIIDLRTKYDLKMKVERFVDDVDVPKTDEKYISK